MLEVCGAQGLNNHFSLWEACLGGGVSTSGGEVEAQTLHKPRLFGLLPSSRNV